jgi:hypothetical protein
MVKHWMKAGEFDKNKNPDLSTRAFQIQTT